MTSWRISNSSFDSDLMNLNFGCFHSHFLNLMSSSGLCGMRNQNYTKSCLKCGWNKRLNRKSRNNIQRWKSYCMKSCLSWNFPLSCNLMNNMLGCSRSGNYRSSWRNKTSPMDCLMKSYRKMMLEKSFCLKMTKVGLNCLTLSNCS